MDRPKWRLDALESCRWFTLMIWVLILDIFLLLSLIISEVTQAARSLALISSSLSELESEELLVESFRTFFILKGKCCQPPRRIQSGQFILLISIFSHTGQFRSKIKLHLHLRACLGCHSLPETLARIRDKQVCLQPIQLQSERDGSPSGCLRCFHPHLGSLWEAYRRGQARPLPALVKCVREMGGEEKLTKSLVLNSSKHSSDKIRVEFLE